MQWHAQCFPINICEGVGKESVRVVNLSSDSSQILSIPEISSRMQPLHTLRSLDPRPLAEDLLRAITQLSAEQRQRELIGFRLSSPMNTNWPKGTTNEDN